MQLANQPPTPDWTPEQRLLFEMDTDQIVDSAEELAPLTPADIEVRREQVRRHLQSHGIDLPPNSAESLSSPLILQFPQQLIIQPIASHAAADAIKAVMPWDAGEVRLLQSPMRSELAVEVLVNAARQEEFSAGLFVVRIGAQGAPMAVFGNASPVFSQILAKDLSRGGELMLEWFSSAELGPEQLAVLKKSRRNLRDPATLERYETLIRQLESL